MAGSAGAVGDPGRDPGRRADSPWTVPTRSSPAGPTPRSRAPGGASYRRAGEACGEDGTVLDVGSGAGAASLPLGRPIVAVDISAEMLAALTERAQRLGLPVQTIAGALARRGRPDPGGRRRRVPPRRVQRAGPRTVRRRPDRARPPPGRARAHRQPPDAPLNPLWTRMHGSPGRPAPPPSDAVEVLRELGLSPKMETGPRPPRGEYPQPRRPGRDHPAAVVPAARARRTSWRSRCSASASIRSTRATFRPRGRLGGDPVVGHDSDGRPPGRVRQQLLFRACLSDAGREAGGDPGEPGPDLVW